MSKRNYSKKKGAVKTGLMVFAILILGTGVAMAITKGFTDWNPYGWFNKQCQHEYVEGVCSKCGKEEAKDETADNKETESTTPASFTLGDNVEIVYE